LNTENQIQGFVERITFQSEESGFCVARMKEKGKRELTVIVGKMPSIQEGEVINCNGFWKNDKNFGWQFQVTDYSVELPSTIAGIKKYLASGMIKGIGYVFAERIVDFFGKDTLQIIDERPDELLKVDGIGAKRITSIKETWKEQRAVRDVMLFLQAQGISPMYAQKIYKQYGDQSIAKIQLNPYRLSKDIYGIGFKTADKIAQKLGIAKDSDERIDAGVEFVLSELSNRGNTCYPVDEFVIAAEKLLLVNQDLILQRLEAIEQNYRIFTDTMGTDKVYIWLMSIYNAERGIAASVKRLIETNPSFEVSKLEKTLVSAQKELNIELAENQNKAVSQSLTKKIHIITGGPGTGKSTITKVILKIAKKFTAQILLAAPTGRAAKRLSEITGMNAKTIHSLLEFDFTINGFKKDATNPLEGTLIIVDEASMIDTILMNSLLKAIRLDARVVFIGDIDQLPSVGAGNVLRDFISSEQIPVTRLTEIFRQAASSKIITSAHAINQGRMPNLAVEKASDFFFIEQDNLDAIADTIKNLVHTRLPKTYGFNPFEDIQVLAPMKRGHIGTINLNDILQKTLNPSNTPLQKYGRSFHLRDKVMQIVNNYDKNIFNGDVGIITHIDREDETITVNVDGVGIDYEFSELDQLMLAYAVSVHKYQGSECPCIVMPVHTTHFNLLFRNLLYTGITRGKKLVVMVGTKRALAIALRNNKVNQRHTGLNFVLKTYFDNNPIDQNGESLYSKKILVLDWKSSIIKN
jgi:exodeoxyribonuclease V alpha subunit